VKKADVLRGAAIVGGLVLVWELFLGRFYAGYLEAASRNLLDLLDQRSVVYLSGSHLVLAHGKSTATVALSLAHVATPMLFVLIVLALRWRADRRFAIGVAAAGAVALHLLTIVVAFVAYSSTLFVPGEVSAVTAEVSNFLYLVLYQPARFAQVPLAFLATLPPHTFRRRLQPCASTPP
jgi:hypothetical protein